MNERDSEQVTHSLIARGYERVAHESEADVVLLNTCSVRDMADQKALGKMGMLGRMAKERPHVVFGLLGCMAQARGESLLRNLPHVDLVVGTQKFHRVADYVEELLTKKAALTAGITDPGYSRMDDLRVSIVDVAEEPGSQSTIRDQQLASRQATAFVSIMQGCNMRCTFCIVPQTRGPERSRSIAEIVREVRALVARGIIERLRFTSPHPIGFRDDLIDAISRLSKLAEHVHLPLQSGSNKILRTMHRVYTAERYVDLVRRIRQARDGIAITTDIIVGFPGETEIDYKQTRDLVEEIQFDNAFIFRYSPRRGTPAAEMPDQIDEGVKEERNQDLLLIVNESTRRAGEQLVGRNVEILCEGPSKTNPARLMGRTRTNKIVVFEGDEELGGELVDVRVQQANGFSLYGTAVLPISRASDGNGVRHGTDWPWHT